MEAKNNSFLSRYRETFVMAIGEAIVIALTVAVFLLLKKFDHTVILGAVLGGLVSVLNMFILSFSVNRAVDRYVELRGTREMTEEEETQFVNQHGGSVRAAAQKSYLVRTILMAAALVGSLITGLFNVVAVAVPLLMYRPIIFIFELLIKRKEGA